MKKNKCDECKLKGHCGFQNQVPEGMTMKDCEWFVARTCKDCYNNGRCEFQDAPPPGKFTAEQIEDTLACEYFVLKKAK